MTDLEAAEAALLTDLYQLTMLRAYWERGMAERAVFSLFVRRLPVERNYLLVCGLDDALAYLEQLHFPPAALDVLRGRDAFPDRFLEWLADFRFRGDVWAVPDGTPLFAGEPILEVEAALPEAQLPETFVMNRIHLQTLLASKAARVVHAAQGRTVVDFGLRRAHGTEAALAAARAFHVAGVDATSNVLAGARYGIPTAGTMAHSYVQAHDDEAEAFRTFARLYPETVLLVDTYDTLAGVERVVALARELGPEFRVRALRLDSGDLEALAVQARRILDAAGLQRVGLFASGGLDEWRIAEIIGSGAPVDGFGVGTRMIVSADAPALDIVYKLVAYAGSDRLKLSANKATVPGRKQVFRVEEGGRAVRDVVTGAAEESPGRPLLRKVMERGRRLAAEPESLDEARARAARELAALPDRIRALAPADPGHPVEISAELRRRAEREARRHGEGPRPDASR